MKAEVAVTINAQIMKAGGGCRVGQKAVQHGAREGRGMNVEGI